MRKLLLLSPFVKETRRDLELYFRELTPGIGEILVLDNAIPLYGETTLDDVALRKSPDLKEMVSIRNIIKILNDSDVLMCKGREALRHVRDQALGLLDLRIDEAGVQEIVDDGVDALGRNEPEAVIETLELFAELLGYEAVPAEVLVNDHIMFGLRHKSQEGNELIGPIIMYNDITNTLRLIKESVLRNDPTAQELVAGVATGEIKPGLEEYYVFQFLKQETLKQERPTLH